MQQRRLRVVRLSWLDLLFLCTNISILLLLLCPECAHSFAPLRPLRSQLTRHDHHNHHHHRLLAAKAKQGTSTDEIIAPTTKWYTCSSTKELTKAANIFIQDTDVVAELGAQLRDVSTVIAERCESAVLVDVERKFPTNRNTDRTTAMRLPKNNSTRSDNSNTWDYKSNNTAFREIPSLSDWRKAFFVNNDNNINDDANDDDGLSQQKQNTYDVLVVDVSGIVGNDLEWTTFSIIQDFLAFNKALGGRTCHTVLVKSAGLNRLASRLIHGRVWNVKEMESMAPPPTTSTSKSTHNQNQPPPPLILATVGVQEYRQTMKGAVQPGDAVLEVGCHCGTSTVLLDNKAKNSHAADDDDDDDGIITSTDTSTSINGGYCIGLDVGSSIIESAKKRHPTVYFQVGDAWKTAQILRIQQEYLASASNDSHEQIQIQQQRIGFDVVYVDVGGLSGSDGVLEALMLLTSLEYALEPRVLAIKSQCMRKLASALIPFWQAPERRAYDDNLRMNESNEGSMKTNNN